MENEPAPLGADPGPFYHGTKADLKPGDLLEPGNRSNFGERRNANYVYLTATLDAATWGAELAVGEGPGRIYLVEPTGPFEDDPNLTDKKFPGNPTRSYRTRQPLRITRSLGDDDEQGEAGDDSRKAGARRVPPRNHDTGREADTSAPASRTGLSPLALDLVS